MLTAMGTDEIRGGGPSARSPCCDSRVIYL